MITNNDDILLSELEGKAGNIGLVTINRPQALNALTHEMCIIMRQQLEQWAKDKHIKCVVVRGSGDKAFCAGGDIRRIYELGKEKNFQQAEQFFFDEYRNNFTIGNYEKPYIALMDGITMGGGVGISLHGSHRVVTERTLFAMPETGIGFFPDVGGSHFLSRCEGELGTFLALTGTRLSAASLVDAGMADYIVPSYHLEELIAALTDKDIKSKQHVAELITGFAAPTEPSSLLKTHRGVIEECFVFDEIGLIFQTLDKHNSEWSNDILEGLQQKSPLSLHVTLRQIRTGVSMNLAECLRMEYCLSQHFLRSHDFYEGIRAQLVDKDKSPQWSANSIDAITPEDVDAFFTAIDGNELVL